ncbi:MAG: protein-(glutamine-N5) methyltransferase, release factor-specific [Kangiellaceae bacterium]|nr:protein-(glutamine-N5) methyltransferase, release factor-specific [Kangiellaceae bacterium]
METSIEALLVEATEKLSGLSESPKRDAEVLLASALGKNRTYLITWADRILEAAQAETFRAMIAKRATGEPVAYITGIKEFWGLNLRVTSDTLIPRPDTETLVELALDLIPESPVSRIADLGTGTGAIALAIASERPSSDVVAIDSSPAALAIAKGNAARLQINNVQFGVGSWCSPLSDKAFDIIIANPPYIDKQDPHLSLGDVRFEPQSALVAEHHGLSDIEAIAEQARGALKTGGWIALEHGWQQGEAVVKILTENGYSYIDKRLDLGGNWRVTFGQWLPLTTDHT